MTWTKIWKQAMTQSLPFGLNTPSRKTLGFSLSCPLSGHGLRIRLNNEDSRRAARIRGIAVETGRTVRTLTVNGRESFSIPAGQSVCTDPLLFEFSAGDILSLRFFPLTKVNDINYIESEAFAYRGDLLHEPKLPPCPKTATEEKFQICCSMPAFPATDSFTGGPVSLIPFSGNGGWTDSTGTCCMRSTFPA